MTDKELNRRDYAYQAYLLGRKYSQANCECPFIDLELIAYWEEGVRHGNFAYNAKFKERDWTVIGF